jgi:hypothetical protein
MDEVVILLLMTCILIFIIIIFPHSGFYKKSSTCNSIPIQNINISDNTVQTIVKQHKEFITQKPIVNNTNTNTNTNNLDPVNANIMLDQFYIPASNFVPEDYPRKQIGECPYSKKQSTDLPLANVSLCGINKGKPMKLSQM